VTDKSVCDGPPRHHPKKKMRVSHSRGRAVSSRCRIHHCQGSESD
jgi:hypothetical protein